MTLIHNAKMPVQIVIWCHVYNKKSDIFLLIWSFVHTNLRNLYKIFTLFSLIDFVLCNCEPHSVERSIVTYFNHIYIKSTINYWQEKNSNEILMNLCDSLAGICRIKCAYIVNYPWHIFRSTISSLLVILSV